MRTRLSESQTIAILVFSLSPQSRGEGEDKNGYRLQFELLFFWWLEFSP
jgi:hypothetical protein